MSDYSLQATWSTKDALATGQALKAISATELGTEFSAIATAVATKYDADDLASTAEARALTATNKLLTPDTLDDVLTHNDGILKDLFSISGSAADGLLAWDNGTTTAKLFTLGTGLAFSGDTVALSATLQALHGLTPTDSNIIVGNGSTWVAESGATARTSLGLAIGTNVQAWDANLDQIAALTPTDSYFIVGNGSAWVTETTTTVRTSLGLGTSDSPTFNGLTVTSQTLGSATLTGPSANRLEVGGRVAFIHDNTSYTSAEIFFSTSAPTTEGSNGDIYFEYTA